LHFAVLIGGADTGVKGATHVDYRILSVHLSITGLKNGIEESEFFYNTKYAYSFYAGRH
jgi:hypothetical protein